MFSCIFQMIGLSSKCVGGGFLKPPPKLEKKNLQKYRNHESAILNFLIPKAPFFNKSDCATRSKSLKRSIKDFPMKNEKKVNQNHNFNHEHGPCFFTLSHK